MTRNIAFKVDSGEGDMIIRNLYKKKKTPKNLFSKILIRGRGGGSDER